jgi:hypothetical protein
LLKKSSSRRGEDSFLNSGLGRRALIEAGRAEAKEKETEVERTWNGKNEDAF